MTSTPSTFLQLKWLFSTGVYFSQVTFHRSLLQLSLTTESQHSHTAKAHQQWLYFAAVAAQGVESRTADCCVCAWPTPLLLSTRACQRNRTVKIMSNPDVKLLWCFFGCMKLKQEFSQRILLYFLVSCFGDDWWCHILFSKKYAKERKVTKVRDFKIELFLEKTLNSQATFRIITFPLFYPFFWKVS